MDSQVVVVDTNILLHCRFVDELDWSQLGIDVGEVCVPLRVVDELDAKKYDPTARIAKRAKKVLAVIESALETSRQLAGGAVLTVDASAATKDRSAWADDDIIATCLRLAMAGRKTTLLTNDTGLRVRASAQFSGSVSISRPPPDFFPGVDEDDESPQVRTLRQQLAEKTKATAALHVSLSGASFLNPPLPLRFETNLAPSQAVRDKARQVPNLKVPRQRDDRFMLAVTNDVTSDQVADFNAERRKWLEEFESWLWSRIELGRRLASAIELPFVVVNNGGVTAQDVELRVQMPPTQGWTLCSRRELEPEAAGPEPEAPYRPEHRYDIEVAPVSSPDPMPVAEGPRWTIAKSSEEATIKFPQVRPSGRPVAIEYPLMLTSSSGDATPLGGRSIAWEIYSTTPSFVSSGAVQVLRRTGGSGTA